MTLENLEILASSFNGSIEGTLLERLDTCCTPFGMLFFCESTCRQSARVYEVFIPLLGRRLMRSWLVNPPCHPQVITKRQDAIGELIELSSQLQGVREGLRRLPDLERLLTKFVTSRETACVCIWTEFYFLVFLL